MNLFAKKILSVDLQGVRCFLNTSCHRAAFPLWLYGEEEKGLQGHGPTPDLIAATIPY